MGLTCLIKLIQFLYLIFAVFYTTSVVLMLVSIPEFTALIPDFQNGGRPPSLILKFSQYFSKIQICAYFYVNLQNLVKIGRSAAELLRIIDFQNGGRPPFRILKFSPFLSKFKFAPFSKSTYKIW